jgi:hypothetical protein
LNYLWLVAPSFSNRVKCDATSCPVPYRTAPCWSDLVHSNSWRAQKGDPNRNSTERSEPQKAQKGRKAQNAERRRKGLF